MVLRLPLANIRAVVLDESNMFQANRVPVYNGRRRIGLLVFVISMLGAQTESEVDGQCFRDVELLMWRCCSFIITNTWTQIKKMLYVFMYIAI